MRWICRGGTASAANTTAPGGRGVYRKIVGSLAAALLLCTACAGPTVSAGPPDARFTFEERHMGVAFRITAYAPDTASASHAARAAFLRVAELDQRLSDYDPHSELRQLCRLPAGTANPASPDLIHVLERAAAMSRASDGAFDVTVGPAVRLWRRSRRQRELPSPVRLATARSRMGFDAVQVSGARITLTRADMLLDLGGIAKGYGADEALRTLARAGIHRAMVDAGGDLALGDPPPGRAGWRIRLSPSLDPNADSQHVELANCGVATSGDAFRHVEIDGVRYSHIVDPRTGLGVTTGHAVAVVASDATTADALASALCVLEPAKGDAVRQCIAPDAAVRYWNSSGRILMRLGPPPPLTPSPIPQSR